MALAQTALLTASFVLGLGHAFEVDHMTAVSAFVATRPRPREAAIFGAKWASGHGISLLLFGSALFLLKIAVTPAVAQLFERAVGVALLALGIWTLVRLRAGLPREAHAHTHHHGDGPVWMGLLHGLAGTGAFVGQAVVVFAVSAHGYALVVLYTLAFSVGVLASMTAFAGALGTILARAGRALKAVQAAVALWACAVGVYWIAGYGS